MNSEFNQRTIAAYLKALWEGLAHPPPMHSVWYEPSIDRFLSPSELAKVGLDLYKRNKGHPSILMYAVEFGGEAERAFVREEFFKAYQQCDKQEFYEDWIDLIPRFVADDPSLLGLIPYQKGGISHIEPKSDTIRHWLALRLPEVLADVERVVRGRLASVSTDPDTVEFVCELLHPLGRDISQVLSSEVIETLKRVVVQTWRNLRFQAHEEDYNPAHLSGDRLQACWRFGWENEIRELCDEQVFVRDCLAPYPSPKTLYLVSKDIAENILALSLSSCAHVLSALTTTEDQLETHMAISIQMLKAGHPEHSWHHAR